MWRSLGCSGVIWNGEEITGEEHRGRGNAGLSQALRSGIACVSPQVGAYWRHVS